MSFYYGWRPYVSQSDRKAQAAKKVKALEKKGHVVQPVKVTGRTIATSFWGQAWCDNLEAYSDLSNRLARGRTYLRNGSVIDLQVHEGKVSALVQGSELYEVMLTIAPMEPVKWRKVVQACAGGVGSMMELLTGKLSKAVMEPLCNQANGLFPKPTELDFTCSCPDYASMCKHIAAVFYGVGARLDHKPEMLFLLRGVEPLELVSAADVSASQGALGASNALENQDLGALFGIELEEASTTPPPVTKAPKRTKPSPTAPTKGAPATPPTVVASKPSKPSKKPAAPPPVTMKSLLAEGYQPTFLDMLKVVGLISVSPADGAVELKPAARPMMANHLAARQAIAQLVTTPTQKKSKGVGRTT
jgi:uncharacterized Zn finger protein